MTWYSPKYISFPIYFCLIDIYCEAFSIRQVEMIMYINNLSRAFVPCPVAFFFLVVKCESPSLCFCRLLLQNLSSISFTSYLLLKSQPQVLSELHIGWTRLLPWVIVQENVNQVVLLHLIVLFSSIGLYHVQLRDANAKQHCNIINIILKHLNMK